MAKRRLQEHHEEEMENHERWLLTYADMITLLLGLFIMLFAMSNVDTNKYQQVALAMSNAFGSGGGGDKIIEQTSDAGQIINDFPMPDTNNENTGNKKKSGTGMSEAKRMENLAAKIAKYIKDNGLEGQVKVQNQDRGVVVSLISSYLFDSGSADISDKTRKNIDDIGVFLKSLGNYIRIEGHTDNVPISNSLYADNWDLSTARAKSVMKVLLKDLKFNPERLSSTGYGEYRPLVPNTTPANKSKNRRVEIVVIKKALSKVESGG